MAKKSNRTNILLGVGIISLLLLAAYFGGLFSIAVRVGPSNQGGYATPDQALAQCEKERIYYQGQGQTCDPCGLACPSSAQDGTYDWNSDGVTDVTFSPSKCSSQYTALGNLLEAKSFCHDTIRLCEKQEGTGSITGVTQVKNGKINTVSYSYYLTNCDTGKYVGTSPLKTTVYQLVCDNGFMVDGARTSSQQSNLGSCVIIPQEGTTGPVTKGATLKNIVISSPAESGKSLRITGVADITGLEGNYYVHGVLDPAPTGTFSVVSGFGFQDECGDNPLAATLIKSVKQGDQLVFALDIVAPAVTGSSNIQSGYTVTVFDRCGGTKLATAKGTYELKPKPVPTTTPITIPVLTPPPVEDVQEIIDEQEQVQGTSCVVGEEAIIQECVVARCNSNGLMDAIDPIVCNGVEYASPATTTEDGSAVSLDQVESSKSIWQTFIDWLKKVFRI